LAAPAPLDDLLAGVPQTTADVSGQQTQRLVRAAEEMDRWAAEQWWAEGDPAQVVGTVRRLADAKAQVDAAMNRTVALRVKFAGIPPSDQRRASLCLYLQTTSKLIDLAGRLRHRLREVIGNAAHQLNSHPQQFHELLDLLVEGRVSIGASAVSFVLFDPPPESGRAPYPAEDKYKVLQLITNTRQSDLASVLATFVRQEKDPALVVIGAAGIRIVGVPQKPRPGDDAASAEPSITAKELYDILAKVDSQRLSQNLAEYREKLLVWLKQRIQWGVLGDSYRWGHLDVRAGDWLLMRNPSPYNLFSDLSPGLFTHVGVVAVEKGEDGIRRFVIADLPERGAHIPATNLDAYLMRTLHYAFLRHHDPVVSKTMGQAAADIIGNESQFDLTFQTGRVTALRGRPLKGQRIHTYCAGFLLVCAQQTSAPREGFFPIKEAAAGGNMAANLNQLGLSIGEDFISPTGAIFATRMQIVGWREPMYDPAREVQEAIYDYFAESMSRKTLTPSPDAYQSLREKLAALSMHIPWLARAMAQANDVSEHTDLAAAAKAAAVVETLDDITEANLNAFAESRAAITAGPIDGDARGQYTQDALNLIQAYRQRHAQLCQQWDAGQLSTRQLRIQLVEFYVQRGQRQLDERFFQFGSGDSQNLQ